MDTQAPPGGLSSSRYAMYRPTLNVRVFSCRGASLTPLNPRGHLPSGEETSSSHSDWNETPQPYLCPTAFLRVPQMGMEGLRTPDDER